MCQFISTVTTKGKYDLEFKSWIQSYTSINQIQYHVWIQRRCFVFYGPPSPPFPFSWVASCCKKHPFFLQQHREQHREQHPLSTTCATSTAPAIAPKTETKAAPWTAPCQQHQRAKFLSYVELRTFVAKGVWEPRVPRKRQKEHKEIQQFLSTYSSFLTLTFWLTFIGAPRVFLLVAVLTRLLVHFAEREVELRTGNTSFDWTQTLCSTWSCLPH